MIHTNPGHPWAAYPPPPVPTPPRGPALPSSVRTALLLLAVLLVSIVGGCVGTAVQRTINPTTCYASSDFSQAGTNTPICVYGRPVR